MVPNDTMHATLRLLMSELGMFWDRSCLRNMLLVSHETAQKWWIIHDVVKSHVFSSLWGLLKVKLQGDSYEHPRRLKDSVTFQRVGNQGWGLDSRFYFWCLNESMIGQGFVAGFPEYREKWEPSQHLVGLLEDWELLRIFTFKTLEGPGVWQTNHAKIISVQGKHPSRALDSNCMPDFLCSGFFICRGYQAMLESREPMIKFCFPSISRTQKLSAQQHFGACLFEGFGWGQASGLAYVLWRLKWWVGAH